MKSLINVALLKEQLKRFWIIAALPLVIYILFVVLPIYQMSYTPQQAAKDLIDLLAMKNPVMIVACVAVPIFVVYSGFSYLFQVKSATAMHAYPVNKTQLFFTNVLSGLILMLIPLIILCLLLLNPVEWVKPEVFMEGGNMRYYGPSIRIPRELFPNGINDGAVINTFPVVAGFFFRTVLSFIFYYSVFLTAAFVSGSAVIYGAVSAVLTFIPMGLSFLSELIMYYCCFGYEVSISLTEKVLKFTNPVAFSDVFNYYDVIYGDGYMNNPVSTHPYILSYILIAAVLFLVSFWCGHIRRQERTEDSVVFVPLKNVFIFLISTFGSVMLGIFLLMMWKSIVFMYVGFAAGFVGAYFIAQMIAEKTFNVLDKSKDLIKFGSVIIVLFILAAGVIKLDLTGYSRYSPDPDDIEGVYLYHPYQYMAGTINPILYDNFFITDPKIISDAAAVHKEIVESRNELRDVFIENITMRGSYSEKYGLIKGQYFTFKLKNGKVVTRSYMVSQDFAEAAGLNALRMKDEVVLSNYYSFKTPEIIDKIELNYVGKEGDSSVKIYIEQPEQVIEALAEIEKDIIALALENQKAEAEYMGWEQERTYMPVETKYPVVSGSIWLKEENRWENYIMSYDYFGLEGEGNTAEWLRKEGYIK